MDPDVYVGLVLVDACVSMCRLNGKPGMLDLHCVPGHTVNMPATLRHPADGYASYIRPLSSCASFLMFALDTLTTSKPGLSERQRPRCLGTAIHEALTAIKETRESGNSLLYSPHMHTDENGHPLDSDHLRRERIVLMTCGPPTRGPGAVPHDFVSDHPRFTDAKKHSQEFFDRLADVAVGLNVKVDLYGISFSPIGLALVRSLPKATCGIISLHSVITPDLFGYQIADSLNRTFGDRGIFDIRLSRGMRLTSIIGDVTERLRPEEAGERKLTTNACLLRSVEIGSSVSLYMEATSDFGQEDLYIQVDDFLLIQTSLTDVYWC